MTQMNLSSRLFPSFALLALCGCSTTQPKPSKPPGHELEDGAVILVEWPGRPVLWAVAGDSLLFIVRRDVGCAVSRDPFLKGPDACSPSECKRSKVPPGGAFPKLSFDLEEAIADLQAGSTMIAPLEDGFVLSIEGSKFDAIELPASAPRTGFADLNASFRAFFLPRGCFGELEGFNWVPCGPDGTGCGTHSIPVPRAWSSLKRSCCDACSEDPTSISCMCCKAGNWSL